MARTYKILAIDGGGARGIIPSIILKSIVDRCSELAGRRLALHEIFDVITGTSTGAVITLLVSKPQPLSPDDLIQLYAHDAWQFFHRSTWRAIWTLNGMLATKYPASSVAGTLRKFIGAAPELKDALTEIVIPIYDIRKKWPRTVLFSRRFARLDDGYNFRMCDVGQAATMAPGYFPSLPIHSLHPAGAASKRRTYHPVDGGVYINNPAMEGLCHARELAKSAGQRDANYLVVSLGTGYHDEPLPVKKHLDWGLITWALGQHILNVMFEGQAEAASMQLEQMMGEDFFRFQARLAQPLLLDDTRPAAIAILRAAAEECVLKSLPQIRDQLCPRLVEAAAKAAGTA